MPSRDDKKVQLEELLAERVNAEADRVRSSADKLEAFVEELEAKYLPPERPTLTLIKGGRD